MRSNASISFFTASSPGDALIPWQLLVVSCKRWGTEAWGQ